MVRRIKKIIPKIPKRLPTQFSKRKAPVSLRTTRDELDYLKAKKLGHTKPLSEEPSLREWKHWVIIDNEFPYSAAFKVHHLLLPKREVDQYNLSLAERRELNKILDEISTGYDCVLINFKKKQSIRNHFHIHLLTYLDKRRQMKI